MSSTAALAPGTRVFVRDDAWLIDRVHPPGSEDDDALVDLVTVDGRSATCTLVASVERMTPEAVSQRRVTRRRARRLWLSLRAGACAPCRPLAPVGLDLAIVDYQLAPLMALLGGDVSRVLVADAVGLGKTIEGGLAVREAWLRRGRLRSLVACPSALVPQWVEELRGKLHVAAGACDAAWLARQAAMLPPGTNPWSLEACHVVSLDFIKQPHVLDGATRVAWDVVVVDEAHHVTRPTFRWSAAHALGRAAEWLLLLTATPHDGRDDTFARLLATGRLAGDDPIMLFRRTRERLDRMEPRRTRTLALRPSPAEARLLTTLEHYIGAALPSSAGGAVELLAGVLRRRARSSATALVRTVDRRLELLDARQRTPPAPTQPPLFALEPVQDDEDEPDAIVGAASGTAWPRERAWLSRLRLAGVSAARAGRKFRRLLRFLERTAPESVVVFTEYRATLLACWQALVPRVTVATMSGALPPADRTAALRAFLDGRARVLLTTDVAAEGLNLHQRARMVVHLDEPWTPRRLEQRAGRVDRFGQTRTVHVVSFVYDDAFNAAQRARLLDRTRAADAAQTDDGAEGFVARERGRLKCPVGLDRASAEVARELEGQRQAHRQLRRERIREGKGSRGVLRFQGRRHHMRHDEVAVVEVTIRRDDGFLVARTLSCQRSALATQAAIVPPVGGRRAAARRAAVAAWLERLSRESRRQPSLFEPGAMSTPPRDSTPPTASTPPQPTMPPVPPVTVVDAGTHSITVATRLIVALPAARLP